MVEVRGLDLGVNRVLAEPLRLVHAPRHAGEFGKGATEKRLVFPEIELQRVRGIEGYGKETRPIEEEAPRLPRADQPQLFGKLRGISRGVERFPHAVGIVLVPPGERAPVGQGGTAAWWAHRYSAPITFAKSHSQFAVSS